MKLTPKKAGKASRCVMAAALVALSLPALTGCIDDKYDLSDVDTTVRVNVDNLTVPVNIDAVTLRSIFDLKSDSKVKEVDGAYAYVDNGDFTTTDFRLSANIAPCRIFSGGVNLGVGTFGASFGWVANLHLTGFNFFLGMDRVPGKLCKQGVPLSSNAQVTMGINFPF